MDSELNGGTEPVEVIDNGDIGSAKTKLNDLLRRVLDMSVDDMALDDKFVAGLVKEVYAAADVYVDLLPEMDPKIIDKMNESNGVMVVPAVQHFDVDEYLARTENDDLDSISDPQLKAIRALELSRGGGDVGKIIMSGRDNFSDLAFYATALVMAGGKFSRWSDIEQWSGYGLTDHPDNLEVLKSDLSKVGLILVSKSGGLGGESVLLYALASAETGKVGSRIKARVFKQAEPKRGNIDSGKNEVAADLMKRKLPRKRIVSGKRSSYAGLDGLEVIPVPFGHHYYMDIVYDLRLNPKTEVPVLIPGRGFAKVNKDCLKNL
ncbi:MAG: hypothetical protein AAB373_01935 [Patescibacteria group bacterium]